MGFFSDIRDKIFNRHQAAAPAVPVNRAPSATPSPAPQPSVAQAAPAPAAPAPAPATTPAAAAPLAQNVDVSVILDQAVAESGQTLNWRTSIVDLMKALGIDSSLTARKELARELNYTGDTEDSATMNIWLHKQVLAKLAANGGTVPADLLD